MFAADSFWPRPTFPPGRVTRLHAASGRGKSTALRVLAGLLRPERGKVTCFGYDPHAARDLVCYLPQQSTLLETSIAENLRVLSGASSERLAEVAVLTGLDWLLRELPMGAETLVSSGGRNLSSGQRQLILLTAACASDRPLVLLDEPTSQVDAATKARIRWSELARDRALVVVEHESREKRP